MCIGVDNMANHDMFIIAPHGISDVGPYDLPVYNGNYILNNRKKMLTQANEKFVYNMDYTTSALLKFRTYVY